MPYWEKQGSQPLGDEQSRGSLPRSHRLSVLCLILAAGNRVGFRNRQDERSGMRRSPRLAGWPGGKEVNELTERGHYVLRYFPSIGHQKRHVCVLWFHVIHVRGRHNQLDTASLTGASGFHLDTFAEQLR